MGEGIERRFDRYCEVITEVLAHADRRQLARWYLKGLVLPGSRKSVEPMAARVCPRDVRSAHQSMHPLVAESDWSDGALLRAVAGQVLPALVKGDAPCMWIVDDTGFPSKGDHSVGVARQNCGQLGKTDNCHVAVSLSLPSEAGSLPMLPGCTCLRGGPRIRGGVALSYRARLALLCHRGRDSPLAHRGGAGRGVVPADAAYGDEAAFRDRLTELGTTAEREELSRLRREVRTSRIEREILSKAAGWFARETARFR